MRWNCPHCSTYLEIPDEKLSENWSFAKCYHCHGYAMVRMDETQSNAVATAGARPSVEMTGHRIGGTQSQNISFSAPPDNTLLRRPSKPAVKQSSRNRWNSSSRTEARAIHSEIPTVTSHPSTPAPQVAPVHTAPAPQSPDFVGTLPHPLPDLNARKSSITHRILQVSVGAFGALAIGSGIYLFDQGQELWEKARRNTVAQTSSEDRLQTIQSAPNPERTAPTRVKKSPTSESKIVSDQINSQSAAPKRVTPTQKKKKLLIRVSNDYANLRSGPSTKHAVVGIATPDERYVVTGWKGRWYKVLLDSETKEIAWVRSDVVKKVFER